MHDVVRGGWSPARVVRPSCVMVVFALECGDQLSDDGSHKLRSVRCMAILGFLFSAPDFQDTL
jgi:aspartokinase-like uncharacterized kinase